MTAKPKPMKPVKAWAIFREDGSIPERGSALIVGKLRRNVSSWAMEGERVARVEIREIRRKPAKGK